MYEVQATKRLKINEETSENLILNIRMLNDKIHTLCDQIETMCKKIKFYENLNDITQTLPGLQIDESGTNENHKKRSR